MDNYVPIEALDDFVVVHHNVENLESRMVQNVLHQDAAVHVWPEANVPRRTAQIVKELFRESGHKLLLTQLHHRPI